jgi:hypothetical protein
MIVDEKDVVWMRCCGPEGCGERVLGQSDRAAGVRHCIGAKCMAWRWYDGTVVAARAATGDRRGFCGIAGEPFVHP